LFSEPVILHALPSLAATGRWLAAESSADPLLRRLAPNVYEGWLVVGSVALIVTMVGASFFYGFGLVFNPIRDEFGWSNAAVSLAFSLRTEAGGIAAPVVGFGVDRAGPRRVLVTGIFVMAAGVFLMSFMQALWQFYVTMIIIALGTSAAGGQVGLVATATWFEQRRGRAMSLMTLGGGLAGTLVVGIAWLVEAAGWRGALRWLGLMVLVIGIPLGLNVRNRPPGHPQPLDGLPATASPLGGAGGIDWGVPPRVAMTSGTFILLAIATAGIGCAQTSIIVHQVPFLESLGMSKGVAGSMVAVFTLTSVSGRLGFGFLADKVDKRLVLAAAVSLTLSGMVVLALAQNQWMAVAGLVVAAPGFGGAIPVRPALVADYFGTRFFGTLNGTLFFTTSIGAFTGPLLIGWAVDRSGDYTLGWFTAVALASIAVPAFLAARRPTALADRYRLARLTV